jgi:hypothetical protein
MLRGRAEILRPRRVESGGVRPLNAGVRCHVNEAAPIPVDSIRDPEVAALAEEARQFVLSQSWCKSVQSTHLAWAVVGVLGVFRVEVAPSRPNVERSLWVVVGDVPSAYLTCEGNPTWREALEGYVREMRKWVAAIRRGAPLYDVIPTRVTPTVEHADMLHGRLNFISREILSIGAEEVESDT